LRRQPRIVGGDDRRQAELRLHLAQQQVKRVRGGFFEIASGLVRQQQRGLHHHRARHRDALLFATDNMRGGVPTVRPIPPA
jgi:hypothetical protein